MQRENGLGAAKIIPCPGSLTLITRAISLSNAHLHKSSGAQGHNGRWEAKLRTRRKAKPVQAPPRTGPGKPQAQDAGMKPIKISQHQGNFRNEYGCSLLIQDTLQDARKELFKIAQDFLRDVQKKYQRQRKGEF